MSKFIWHFKVLKRLTGKSTLVWIAAGTASACCLSMVELLLSIQIANLLAILGLSQQEIKLPMGLNAMAQNTGAFMLMLIFLAGMRGFFHFVLSHSANFVHESITERLRLLAFHQSFGPSSRMFSLTVLMTRISEHFPKASLFTLNLANFIPSLLQVVFLGTLLFIQSKVLTLVALAAVGIVALIIHGVNYFVRRIISTLPAAIELVMQKIMRMGKNWYLLKAVRTMNLEHKRLVLSSLKYANQTIRANAIGNMAAVLPQILGLMTVIVLISIQLEFKHMTGLAFVSFLYLFLRVIQCLGGLSAAYGNLNIYSGSYKIVERYIEEYPPEEYEKALEPVKHLSSFGLRRWLHAYDIKSTKEEDYQKQKSVVMAAPEIEFKNVSFRYSENTPWVLKNFNYLVKAGDQSAIMGASGSGKSTILALILGLLEPTEGSVRVGDKEPKEFFEGARVPLGFVGAEPYIIDGSIRDNLLYGSHHHYSDETLINVLRRAELTDLLEKIPKILDYPLTESGEGLSTGQKQRLMFARALLCDPKILLLDEASSNLDETTESLLANQIKSLQGQCTVLVITHRSAFVRSVENLIQLIPPKFQPEAHL